MESEFQKSLPCFCSCPYHLLGSHEQSGHLQHAFRTGLINAERIFKDCKFLQAEAGYSKSIRPPQLKQLIGPPMAVNQRPQRQSQIHEKWPLSLPPLPGMAPYPCWQVAVQAQRTLSERNKIGFSGANGADRMITDDSMIESWSMKPMAVSGCLHESGWPRRPSWRGPLLFDLPAQLLQRWKTIWWLPLCVKPLIDTCSW